MRVVIDTNVLVSGLLSPFGPASEIVRMMASGALILCYDARILSEYQKVLARKRFSFDQIQVGHLLSLMEATGEIIAGEPLRDKLVDPDDEPFLEVLLTAKAQYLITRNIRHYPKINRLGTGIVTPEIFLEIYRKKKITNRDN